jgi:hypothetical protein
MEQILVDFQMIGNVCVSIFTFHSKHIGYTSNSEQAFNPYGDISSGPLHLFGHKLLTVFLFSFLSITL